jgi:formamidopyrimidine-DNA glycosylase
MPELPEVQTTINGLVKKVLNRTFIDVWTDIKRFESIKRELKNLPAGRQVKKVYRRAKNIIFELSENYSLLVHQKMTGHLLYGEWILKDEKWQPINNKNLEDPYNRFIHLIFFLDNKKMLALSDVRKFAKVKLYKTEELKKELEKLGPEPLEKSFTFEKFKKALEKKSGKIKQVLMDQNIISGIGNIYASEVLWASKIYPEKSVAKLSEKELKSLYKAIKKVLTLAVKLGGESFSDYRKPDGSKGGFDAERKVYKRENQKCKRCKTLIKRIKIGQRSSFFCPNCQKL